MVIGPTPPGTGVIAPATVAALSKCTSPTSRVLPSPRSGASIRLMPTSITVAPGLIQSPGTISGRPDGGHHDISPPHGGGQIPGARMRDGHGAAVAQKQVRHGFADDIAAPDDHGVKARQAAVMVAQHHQTAKRRAGHHRLLPGAQKPDIGDMKPVHILGRINTVDYQIAVQVIGQRQLHQDTMHRRIGIEPVKQRQKIGFAGVGLQLVLERVHANFDGLLAFGTHVDLARGILADQHHRKTGRNGVLGLQGRHMLGHLPAHPGCKSFAVDYLRTHPNPFIWLKISPPEAALAAGPSAPGRGSIPRPGDPVFRIRTALRFHRHRSA